MIIFTVDNKTFEINRRTDCPFYSTKAGGCKDDMYKLCSPKRCNRIRGLPKAKGYGSRSYRGKQ